MVTSSLATLIWHGDAPGSDSEFSWLELPADGRLLLQYDRSLTNETLPWLKRDAKCLPVSSSIYGEDFQTSWSQIVSFVNDSPLQSTADAEEALADAYDATDVDRITGAKWTLLSNGISANTLDALTSEQRALLSAGPLEALQALKYSVFPAETIDADSKAGEFLRYLRDAGSQRLLAHVESTKPECIIDEAK